MSYNMQLESSCPVAKRRPLGSTATDATALPIEQEEWKFQYAKISIVKHQQLFIFTESYTNDLIQLVNTVQLWKNPVVKLINTCILRSKILWGMRKIFFFFWSSERTPWSITYSTIDKPLFPIQCSHCWLSVQNSPMPSSETSWGQKIK